MSEMFDQINAAYKRGISDPKNASAISYITEKAKEVEIQKSKEKSKNKDVELEL